MKAEWIEKKYMYFHGGVRKSKSNVYMREKNQEMPQELADNQHLIVNGWWKLEIYGCLRVFNQHHSEKWMISMVEETVKHFLSYRQASALRYAMKNWKMITA